MWEFKEMDLLYKHNQINGCPEYTRVFPLYRSWPRPPALNTETVKGEKFRRNASLYIVHLAADSDPLQALSHEELGRQTAAQLGHSS